MCIRQNASADRVFSRKSLSRWKQAFFSGCMMKVHDNEPKLRWSLCSGDQVSKTHVPRFLLEQEEQENARAKSSFHWTLQWRNAFSLQFAGETIMKAVLFFHMQCHVYRIDFCAAFQFGHFFKLGNKGNVCVAEIMNIHTTCKGPFANVMFMAFGNLELPAATFSPSPLSILSVSFLSLSAKNEWKFVAKMQTLRRHVQSKIMIPFSKRNKSFWEDDASCFDTNFWKAALFLPLFTTAGMMNQLKWQCCLFQRSKSKMELRSWSNGLCNSRHKGRK